MPRLSEMTEEEREQCRKREHEHATNEYNRELKDRLRNMPKGGTLPPSRLRSDAMAKLDTIAGRVDALNARWNKFAKSRGDAGEKKPLSTEEEAKFYGKHGMTSQEALARIPKTRKVEEAEERAGERGG
jgi:hypothetical protein